MIVQTMHTKATCRINDLGIKDYQQVYLLQKNCVNGILEGEPQTLLLCEHPVVITMGRSAKKENLLVSQEVLKEKDIHVFNIDRGGDITLHCPGQLVAYPIFHLSNFGKDLKKFLFSLEQVAIDLLRKFDILANRSKGQTGIWLKDKKIASIGIGVRKWISFHGLAININTNLSLFSLIKPCGLPIEMTSMEEITGENLDINDVKKRLIACFKNHFQLILL